MKILIYAIGFLFVNLVSSQEVFGEWKTIDDNTGLAKSIVEVYEQNGKVFGRIKKILKEEKRDVRCVYCKGDQKNQKVEGMLILKNLSKDKDKYEGGTVTDPENGKTYDAKMWLNEDDPNVLMVRGYLSFLYRTQEWKRIDD
ncbi:DUF2147 domain-containing protein [Psychroflexus sp. MES1-P1E]|jgi:uncharacterized protein (DUF2147 family)|uniref:DUF2147 domain-containing protein n=1 Tax=Psychroflexus sp. MES1-P1E TaxID=2058320 RepID=UPI000C7DE827|nr:DUF2147 domain-containing protein [Psychroflexus sp. MES1-P1E]PKG41174.1 DUF2147 domain-containing protein [Psychroflexus sp. MES1-P1E]